MYAHEVIIFHGSMFSHKKMFAMPKLFMSILSLKGSTVFLRFCLLQPCLFL
jgi:hypothetical protein